MHITIYSDKDTSKYQERLAALGFTCDVLETEFDIQPDLSNVKKAAAALYNERRERTDVIQFIIDNWDERASLLGRHYGRAFSSYRVCIVRHRDGWEDTAEHELLHAAEDIIAIYTGVSLSQVFDVSSFGDDVVHGRHPDYTEYEYDAVWQTLTPYLKMAVGMRKTMALRSAKARLIVKLREMVALLRARVEEITIPEKKVLSHPIPKQWREYVSQAFLVPSDVYQSGVHNGTDWAVPENTPIYAPADGEVVRSYFHPETGYACDYAFGGFAMRLLHLCARPVEGPRKRGEVIAYSGNTGKTTGPHVHLDLWHGGEVDVSLIRTREGVETYLLDPYVFFAHAE